MLPSKGNPLGRLSLPIPAPSSSTPLPALLEDRELCVMGAARGYLETVRLEPSDAAQGPAWGWEWGWRVGVGGCPLSLESEQPDLKGLIMTSKAASSLPLKRESRPGVGRAVVTLKARRQPVPLLGCWLRVCALRDAG